MKEATLYEHLENGYVRCLTCNHYCRLAPGALGICGVKENRAGTLRALNYGLTIARALDPIEKKPLYDYLADTSTYSLAAAGCNLSCMWCQNHEISQIKKGPIPGIPISAAEHVQAALDHGAQSISYTYSEPTIFLEYALEIMKLADEAGLKNIWVTNGFFSAETAERILPLLSAASVDYKGDDKVYRRYCGARVAPIRENLLRLREAGKHIEVVTLIIPGLNDSDEDLGTIAEFIHDELGQDVPWHISRFFPTYQMFDTPQTPRETIKKALEIGKKAGLKNIYPGNV